VDAEASVGFAFLTERFSTRVTRNAVRREIAVDLLSGPFRRLENRWRFSEDPAGTRVEFEIDFLFKSRLLEALLAAKLPSCRGPADGCFEARAKALYG